MKSKRLRPSWVEILYRVFAVNGWRCPGCGCRMTLRAVFEGGPTTSAEASLRRISAPSRGGAPSERACDGQHPGHGHRASETLTVKPTQCRSAHWSKVRWVAVALSSRALRRASTSFGAGAAGVDRPRMAAIAASAARRVSMT